MGNLRTFLIAIRGFSHVAAKRGDIFINQISLSLSLPIEMWFRNFASNPEEIKNDDRYYETPKRRPRGRRSQATARLHAQQATSSLLVS